jgi:glycerol-3-phosphate dehydrogenase (NAD+)
VTHPEVKKLVAPVELCPILKTLYKILIKRLVRLPLLLFLLVLIYVYRLKFFAHFTCRELATDSILQAIRDESMYDPRERIEMSQRQCLYRPSLLGLPKVDITQA